MPVTLLNPEGLPEVDVYRQVAIATGSRSVFVAGQVARDAEGAPVAPGDLAGQVVQAYRNIAVALQAADASLSDLVRSDGLCRGLDDREDACTTRGYGEGDGSSGSAPAPVTLIGVASLFESDVLVEIEATAVTDR